MPIDLSDLTDILVDQVKSTMGDLLEGAQEDLETFASKIAEDVVSITKIVDAERRDTILRELVGQIQALAELNRLRAVNGTWGTVRIALEAVVNTAVKIFVAL